MRRLPDRLKLASCIPLADSLSYTSTTCRRYWRLLHSAETRHYTLTCEIPVTRSCPGLSTRWVVLFLRRPCTAVSFSSCRKRSGCYDLLKHLIPGSPVGNSTSPTTAQQHGAHVVRQATVNTMATGMHSHQTTPTLVEKTKGLGIQDITSPTEALA
jgi:hypothetical protein